MTDAPERMFIDFSYQEYCKPSELPEGWTGATEYTRADLSDAKDARIAELEKQLANKPKGVTQDSFNTLQQNFLAMSNALAAEKARAEAAEAKLAVAEEAIIWLEAEIKENGFPEEGFMRRKCRATIEQLKGTDQ